MQSKNPMVKNTINITPAQVANGFIIKRKDARKFAGCRSCVRVNTITKNNKAINKQSVHE